MNPHYFVKLDLDLVVKSRSGSALKPNKFMSFRASNCATLKDWLLR
jgi:hypothetical protein